MDSSRLEIWACSWSSVELPTRFLGLEGRGACAPEVRSKDSSVAGVPSSIVEESVSGDLETGLRGAECCSIFGATAGGDPGGV